MQINQALKQFDLNDKEIQVYLAMLELGQAGVQEIAIKANIKRTTAYDILTSLISQGLIGQTQKGKKRLFYAEEPEKLYKLLEEKREKLNDILPILKSLYNTAGSKPKIRYYEGAEGLKNVYRDTLAYQGEMIGFVTGNIIQHLGQDFANEYKERRKKALITVRVIGPDTDEIVDYKTTDKEDIKQTRLVPQKKFPFSIEMNVYGNKIALMSFREQMGIIIESNEISTNLKLLFELAWQGAKNA
ncbi:MAG: helix-turn-helix domain-containing protein [Patescibacteria group bacterium]